MRKLASIQTVNAVEPIPNADAIERVRVRGWWVVGKRGEYRPGDRVVYCEIDSLLPDRPEFEFLRASSFEPAHTDPVTGDATPAGFRIKTVRLRGHVSPGICFPLSILPAGTPADDGADVTAALGASYPVGAVPDRVTFTPDGLRLLVANGGEPNSYNQVGSVDPEGSVTIVTLPVAGTAAGAAVTTARSRCTTRRPARRRRNCSTPPTSNRTSPPVTKRRSSPPAWTTSNKTCSPPATRGRRRSRGACWWRRAM